MKLPFADYWSMENPLKLTNEADVREDFIAPFLAELGYQRGTRYDILRERNLTYPRIFLGRKKKTDQPLVGKADYILSVAGVGRWVIEAKPPGTKISKNDIEQAITYARHPEISAAICVITNGLETHVYEANSLAGSEAAGIEHENDPLVLARDLKQLLGPSGFSHRFRRQVTRLRGGISRGFPDNISIIAGSATYEAVEVSHNLQDFGGAIAPLDLMKESLKGYVSHLAGGHVRVEDGIVKILTEWSMPNDKMARSSNLIGLGTKITFCSQMPEISQDPDNSTFFDAELEIKVEPGMTIFGHAFDKGQLANINMNTRMSARAKGTIDKNRIIGSFFTEYYFDFPDYPMIKMSVEGYGDFSLILDV